jgi:hypothetical protein
MSSTWRASLVPIETWSSAFALVGIEYTEAGCALRGQVVDQRGGGVLHDHESGIRAILVADQECRQAVVVGRIDQLVQAPLAEIEASTGIAALR